MPGASARQHDGGRASRPAGDTGQGPGSAPCDWSNRAANRLFLSRCLCLPPWFRASSLPAQVQPGNSLFLFSLPPPFLERSDAILHRRTSSNYPEVSPVLSSKSDGREGNQPRAGFSTGAWSLCAGRGRSLYLLWGRRPHPRPAPNLAPPRSGCPGDFRSSSRWKEGWRVEEDEMPLSTPRVHRVHSNILVGI